VDPALSALIFLYREVLLKELVGNINSIRAFKAMRLPVVLSRAEIHKLLDCTEGTERLILEMLYGTGLRVNELVNLRIKDIDFDHKRILVFGGKGNKDRFTILPLPIIEKLKVHIQKVKIMHQEDLLKGFGDAYLPDRLGI
jgi:site-specific recombinase XerD